MDDDYLDTTMELVATIPPGRVMTYGAIAHAVSDRLAAAGGARRGGARQAARVLSLWGNALPWWRVVSVYGDVACRDPREALRRLDAEGTPLRSDGARVDLFRARWDPPAPLAGR